MAPELSIVIVHYKTPDMLERCLRSLYATIRVTTYEIIVVDVASDGGIAKLLRERYPAVVCIPLKENSGYGKGVNAGIAQAAGAYFLVLNPDIEALDDAVDALVAYIRHNKTCGMAGPRLLETDGSVQHSAFRFYTPFTILCRRTPLGKFSFAKRHLRMIFLEDKHITTTAQAQRADWLMGSALLVRRSAVTHVGKMDDRFFMYFEDIDWARRFWENGYSVMYVPEARMLHLHKRESHKRGMRDAITNPLTHAHIASALKYFWKYRFRTVHYL